MLDSIARYRSLPPVSAEDKIYIERNFYKLEELCSGRRSSAAEYRSQIREGILPLPTYIVEGIEMYPGDFFVFPDSVGGLGASMRNEFLTRYLRTAESYRERVSGEQMAEEYTAYLSGEYAVCLRWVTTETIFLKGIPMAKIDALMAEPRP